MSFATEWADTLRPHTLRQRLIVWTSALVVILFATLSVITCFLQSRTLEANAQQALNHEVTIVRADVEHQVFGYPPNWPAVLRFNGLNALIDPDLTIEILDTAGTLRYSTDTDNNPILLPVSASVDRTALDGSAIGFTTSIQGHRTLIAITPVYNLQGQLIGVAHVAHSLQEVDAALDNLRFLMIIANIVALGIAIAGGWYLTRRTLTPLTQIAGVANAITQALARQSSRTPDVLRMRVPVVDDEGELGALVTDVNRMLDALSRYDERQRQFITDASHELRTPLTTIRGNLEWVRRRSDLPADEREQALDDAAAEADRMTLLVNHLLTLARAESGSDARPSYQPVELDAILIEIFRIARERIQVQGLTDLEVRLRGMTPAQVQGDAMQLRQVLLILVDNALKYAPHGTLTFGMGVEAGQGNHESATAALTRPDAGAATLPRFTGPASRSVVGATALPRPGAQPTRRPMVHITVSDSGPGINPEDLPHIFDRFYRANRERNREGSGLGLAIARTLIDQHGGTIEATSTPGQGATFTITLPQLPPPPVLVAVGEEREEELV